MKTIILITGGFDPIHSGHIAYFKSARALGDMLIVGINSDSWLHRKKGRAFMPLSERQTIIENIAGVDKVITFNDSDNSAIAAINKVRDEFPEDKIIFANGGDRTANNIPEMKVVDSNLEFVFGVGGEDKKNSSSWILEDWKSPKTIKPWGYYRVLHDVPGTKVKELTVLPGQSLSMQYHNHRLEHWHVAEGTATIKGKDGAGKDYERQVSIHQSLKIEKQEWHQLSNKTESPVRIIEIQYGDKCDEQDIVREQVPTVYVGWDSREDIAYKVCEYSIRNHNKNVKVFPIKQHEVIQNNLYWREPDKFSSTEFTFTRFLVPYLSNYQGWAIFTDCDFLFLDDVKKVFDQADEKYAVMVVKHDYYPAEVQKMDGALQRNYPRKNWSSFILWNCGHELNRSVDLKMVNEESGKYLHRFSWLPDHAIGSLSVEWNWLTDWYKQPKDGYPKALHYTLGGPWFKNYKTCDYSELWMTAYDAVVERDEGKEKMDAYIIHLPSIPASLKTATDLQNSLKDHGIKAYLSEGVLGNEAVNVMEAEGRKIHPWGIKGPNSPSAADDTSVLKAMSPGVRGCFLGHYRLWQKCVELDKPIMIFEDDVVLTRGFAPVTWEDVLIVAIGHPTKSADYWANLNSPIGRPFAEPWTKSSMPGAMGYAIKPHAAKKLLEVYEKTFLPADNAINQYHIKIEICSHLMGRALVDEDGKKSLTRTKFWNAPNK
jgi:cytidyltransferase-like protein